MRLAVATVVAGVVTVVAWRTGDWWVDGYSGADLNRTFGRAFIFLAVWGLVYSLPSLIRRVDRAGWLVFAGWTAYLSLWLIGTWPGQIMTDTVDVVVNSRQGIVYEWFSYVHSLLNIAVLDLVPQVAAFGVLQVLGTASLMAFASVLLLRHGGPVWAVVAMNVVAALSAPVIVNTILYSRDTPYALLHVLLALWVAEVVVFRRALTGRGLVGIALLTGLLSVYRGDGLALLVTVPLLLLLLRPSRRALLGGAAAFGASILLFHAVLPWALSVKEQEPPFAYELSLLLNPLGQVLQTDFYSPNKDADLQTLGRVIDVGAAQRLSTPAEIPVYWDGHWNQAASEEDFEAFERVANRLIRDNLITVVAGRWRTFGATTGLAPGQFTGNAMPEVDERLTWVEDRTAIRGSPPFTALYDVEADIIGRSATFGGLPASRAALFWNFLPSMLILIVAALGFRRFPFEAAFSVVILSRVPLIFAAAPAAQFKYYYAVYLGGIVAAGFLLGRLGRPAMERARKLVSSRRRVRFAQFAVVSATGLALDYAIYTILAASGVDAGWANAVSATAAVSFVFAVSARRIFESDHRFLIGPFLLYAAYQVIAVGAASYAVDVMTDVFGGAYLLGKTVVVPFSFLANFLFMSWLFARRRRMEGGDLRFRRAPIEGIDRT
jgi:GtrA-like protein